LSFFLFKTQSVNLLKQKEDFFQMQRLQVRLLNRGQARVGFFRDNEADFPPASPGGKVRAAMEAVIADILAKAAKQSSGAVSQRVDVKDEDFLKLKRIMRQMGRAGDSMAEEIPGIEDLFNVPYGDSEEVWLASARAFHADSEPYETQMLEYIEDTHFRPNLMAVITKMEASSSDLDIAREQRGGATGSLKALFKELGRLGRKANNIVLNKYEDDPEKLAAWAIASHLKAAPTSGDDGDGEGDDEGGENPQT
jgi:hypothetical protein